MPFLDLNTLSSTFQGNTIYAFFKSLPVLLCFFFFFFNKPQSALGSPTLTEVIQYPLNCLGLLQRVLEKEDVVRLIMGYGILHFRAASLPPTLLRLLWLEKRCEISFIFLRPDAYCRNAAMDRVKLQPEQKGRRWRWEGLCLQSVVGLVTVHMKVPSGLVGSLL